MTRRIYLIGSMRNPNIPVLANTIRDLGHEVHDDWYAPGEQADVKWKEYEQQRGRTFAQAIKGHHAGEVFGYDKKHIDHADTVILMLPAGRSAHLELGYAVGMGKDTHILLDDDPERWDIMYRFAGHVWETTDELLEYLRESNE